MTLSKIEFIIYEKLFSNLLIYIANDDRMIVIERGSITLESNLLDNFAITTTINDALYVSKLIVDFLSINMLTKKRAHIVCEIDNYRIYVKDNKQMFYVIKHCD